MEGPSAEENNPYATPESPPIPPRRIPTNASLALALAMIVVLGICFLFNVGLGIGLTLLALPAYARAVGRSSIQAAAGRLPTTADRLLSFFGSVMIVGACAVAGGIAFFVTCLGTFAVTQSASGRGGYPTESSVWLTLGLSVLGFLLAAGLIYWVCWPKRR